MEDTLRYKAVFQDGRDYGYVEVMDVEGYQHPFAPNQNLVETVGKAVTVTAPVALDNVDQPSRN